MTRRLLIPKISDDIEYHQFSKNFYFIHQKVYDYRIKIGLEFYELLKKVDGKKNLEELAKEFESNEYNVDFLYEILFNRLGSYGIIEADNIQVKKRPKPDYLKLSFIVIPAGVIAKLTPYLKFLFEPKIIKIVMCLSTCITLLGLYLNFSVLNQQNLESIWLHLLIFGFISVTFHEFGHATAAHYYGAKHGGIGGGFYLFSPVYFADVTDIWKLSSKKRIVVNLAGIYFEMIVCSVYILIGIAFEIDFLSIVGLFILLNTLFNLNPFLRSDGYWILTDLLEIPNLYKISSQSLKRLLNSNLKSKKNRPSKREVLLALYAAINYILIGMFIYYVIIVNPTSVIYFPNNIYNYFSNVYHGTQSITLSGLAEFIIPILFYYLLFNFLRKHVSKILISKSIADKG
ncbi:M50 family metallopeptidase [Allomuricauda sp. SCSIO 65647]|uniref:M50 family metallopeptidase n=1 Tax=Allomuricauda sp. SCSIO 65647 TaxID=2908843 RepID=UPI001F246EE3|nr:M50 family metallopeptidase [Muricauda sp. SCSIO 65647]UJH68195.1 M50 family metallopeptidase [Muricauda sp. SCSIO 65647]